MNPARRRPATKRPRTSSSTSNARHPGTVKRLAQALIADTYSEDTFRQCIGKPLAVCVSEYEQAVTGA